MAKDDKRIIVVKRIKKVAAGHHGGAWKIAYADFVTAMMAFFLLLWLLGSTSLNDLKGIADYFNTPLKAALMGGSASSESSSLIKGGGIDLTRSEGQVQHAEPPAQKKTINLKAVTAEALRIERQNELGKLKALKASLEKVIDANAKLQKFKHQILIDITTEGLRIQIVDEENRPMFKNGSAKLESYTVEILREIGKIMNQVPNKVSLSGHTDARPYAFGEKGYSNWDLSADRANASRRELIAGGMAEEKMVRVVGLSSAVLLDAKDSFNPINRRINIIVMNKMAEESVRTDGGTVEVEAESGPSAQQLIKSNIESNNTRR